MASKQKSFFAVSIVSGLVVVGLLIPVLRPNVKAATATVAAPNGADVTCNFVGGKISSWHVPRGLQFQTFGAGLSACDDHGLYHQVVGSCEVLSKAAWCQPTK